MAQVFASSPSTFVEGKKESLCSMQGFNLKQKKWKEIQGAGYIYLVTGLSIVLYGVFLHYVGTKDVLNKVLVKLEVGDTKYPFSFWPFSHFILYVILGFLFPDIPLELTVAGIAWEALESITGHALRSKYPEIRSRNFMDYLKQQKPREDKEDTQYADWMSGSLWDIVFNIIGLLVGMGVHYAVKVPFGKL
jgi:hypothetical protein